MTHKTTTLWVIIDEINNLTRCFCYVWLSITCFEVKLVISSSKTTPAKRGTSKSAKKNTIPAHRTPMRFPGPPNHPKRPFQNEALPVGFISKKELKTSSWILILHVHGYESSITNVALNTFLHRYSMASENPAGVIQSASWDRCESEPYLFTRSTRVIIFK